jgi:lipopolysaccharide heptosyltransferase I
LVGIRIARTIPQMPDPVGIQSLLLMRLSAIGDVVNTLPAVSAVRTAFPKARIEYLVEDKALDLVLGHPDLDGVIVFPKARWKAAALSPRTWSEAAGSLRSLRAGRFDALVDFQGNLKGGLHALLSRIPVRIGFARGHCKEGSHVFTNVHVAPVPERMLRAHKFLALLAPLGIANPALSWKLPPRARSARIVDEFLRAQGLAGDAYAVVHPGTSARGAGKRWPVQRFAELARRIERELGLRVLVAWGPGEAPMAREVVAGSGATLAMETRSLLDLAELLDRAALFVGADSGPLHLASAVACPSVALFGPKDPAIYAPCNPRSRVVRKPRGDGSADMLSIEVGDAFAAARELLAEGSPTPPGAARGPTRSALPA